MYIGCNVVYMVLFAASIKEDVMRLSIEVSSEQHQQLKAVAALSGKSIKAYVLERVLPGGIHSADDAEALRQLEVFMEPRIQAVQDAVVDKTVEQVFEETHREMQ